jgi:hypothetical protein
MTMTDTETIAPVKKRITVPCAPQAAFDTFARNLSTWWPKEHSTAAMNGGTPKAIILEPKPGGRLYEVGTDGGETEWGSVREWDDGKSLVLNWHIGRPVEDTTTVEVSFSAVDDGTEVVLIHRDFERMGEDGPGMREGYNGGWVNVFENHYANAAKAA